VLAALEWTGRSARDLGIDPDRIAIHGISAGAGLAAAAALHMRDHGGAAHLCFQFLSIPELDDRLDTGSMRRFGDTPVWNTGNARISWGAYLGPGVPGTPGVSPYAAPARAQELGGLPPAYIAVMEFDPLRDEGVAYAQALAAAGVTVELHLFPGTYHGSSNVVDAPVTRREMAEEAAVLRAALNGDSGLSG
jgi:acetyl esterase/lipase